MIFLAQAQSLDAINAEFWKDFCIAMMVLLGCAVGIGSLWAIFRKPGKVKLGKVRLADDPAPKIEIVNKRYNHDNIELRFRTIESTVSDHKLKIEAIQAERVKALNRINSRFERVLIGLANICGKLHVPMPDEAEEEKE